MHQRRDERTARQLGANDHDSRAVIQREGGAAFYEGIAVILNAHDKALLMALRRGNHFKSNPGDVTELLKQSLGDVGPSEGLSSARRLYSNGLALFVDEDTDDEGTLMRITDTGIAFADNLLESRRPMTWFERLRSIPRSDWIAAFALILSAVALFKEN